ncbi:MAG: bifunctional DNA-formamidopyrimidine glycosylase/DNA-(apurinic or apyrimidinic site) lyase [Brucellaceae bacterium]|nr:bifunctional DNA-formamidopyrimidine glycosylase/DNA-(apurinic or apyrimidinic site) lyase [Brucellaceae bacterium]
MPELPEVETVRRGLQPVMEGATIASVTQRRADLRFPFPADFVERLTGNTVTAVERRAKYLLFRFANGLTMIGHLGMSGSWRIDTGGDEQMPGQFHHERSRENAHDHVVFELATAAGGAARATYNDPRRFGFMLFAETATANAHPLLAGLGTEPTGNAMSGEVLAALFAGKAAPLKAALLDQKLIAGLGNIYVCEALWRAGLSPRRRAGSIVLKSGEASIRCERLADAVRDVIAEAIEAGGSSLRDHRQTNGELGYFQHSFSVYDREGEPCQRDGCGGTIRRIVQSGRSTFLCPRCQL